MKIVGTAGMSVGRCFWTILRTSVNGGLPSLLRLNPWSANRGAPVFGGLAFGRTIGWSAQQRDSHGVPLATALRLLWRPTLLGALMLAWFARGPSSHVWLFAPFWLPLLAAAPFATLTAWPALGAAMARWRLAAIPDELHAPPELRRLRLPALAMAGGASGPIGPAARQ